MHKVWNRSPKAKKFPALGLCCPGWGMYFAAAPRDRCELSADASRLLPDVPAFAAMPGFRKEGNKEDADHADEQDTQGQASHATGGTIAVAVPAVWTPGSAFVDHLSGVSGNRLLMKLVHDSFVVFVRGSCAALFRTSFRRRDNSLMKMARLPRIAFCV